jgi:hypothetical protein
VRGDVDLGVKVACASSLSKLRVVDAAPDLLHILYIDSYLQSRREMGMCLARLLESEAKYIELSRSLDDDPGTALAREVDNIWGRLIKKFVAGDDILPYLVEARDRFAQCQLTEGYQPLLGAINFFVLEDMEAACREILLETGVCMHEFGPGRLEYLILAIVALEKCLK